MSVASLALDLVLEGRQHYGDSTCSNVGHYSWCFMIWGCYRFRPPSASISMTKPMKRATHHASPDIQGSIS